MKVTYQYGTEAQVRTLVYGDDYDLSYRDNKEAGQATVRVTGKGNYSGYREVHFTIEEQELTDAVITFTDGDSYPYMGTGVAIEPELTVMLGGRTLQKGKDYKVTYTDNKTVGTATATVTGTGSFNGEYQKQFTITTHNINATDINVAPIPNQAYTGVPIVPEVQITCGSYKLVQGVDYNAVISAGDNTNPGVVTMRLEGIGGFTGERNVNFTIATNITKAEVSGIPVELPYKAAQYTIEELSATLRVTLDGRLVSASNYTLSYADGSDGTSAGQQKLILSGVNEYGGTKQLSYTITPKSISDPEIRLAGFVDNITNTADTTQHIQLIWTNKGITLEEKTDYDITYRQEGSSGIFSMIVTGKGNYNGTIEKTYKVEFIDLTGAEITLDKSAYEYTGEDIQPKVTVKLGGIEFKQDENYTVSFENNRNVGVGTVKISGEGYYMGEVTKSFLIVERSISLAVVNDGAGIPAQVYTGKDVEPAIKVTDMIGSRSVTLAEDGDYLLTYDDNRKAGEAWAIVDGIGNYTATQKLRFDILPYTANAPKIVSQTKNSLELGWSTNGAATGYEIQRKTASGSWEHVATVGARNKSFTDTSLAAGTAYTYRIRAYVKGDTNTYYGAWSPEVSGTTRN